MGAEQQCDESCTLAKPIMDILQQSLQAAEILSGDDLFGELGLNLGSATSETAGLPNELEALVSQTQPYDGGGSQSNDPSDYFSSEGGVQFDTSQFLNTSVGVGQQTHNDVQQAAASAYDTSVQNLYQTPYSAQSSTHYMYQQQGGVSLPMQGGSSASTLIPNQASLVSTVSMSHAYSAATCSSVFSRAPTQTVLSTANMNSSPSAGSLGALPAGIQVVNQQAYQALPSSAAEKLQASSMGQNVTVLGTANIQLVQSNSGNNAQNTRQLLLMQRPSAPANQPMQAGDLVNGIAGQQSQSNVAVLRVAGGKQNVDLGDPRVVKALTANFVQKQQVGLQGGQQTQQQQHLLKLGQNAYTNSTAARPAQQPALQKGQPITLQNGQTILLNNGQQVQLCNPPSQGPVQVLQQSQQNTSPDILQQNTRNGQVPIKGIQIASVNIPIASTNSTMNMSQTQSNVLTIPVVAKQDLTRNTASPTPRVTPQGGRVVQIQNSSAVRTLLANSIRKQNNNNTNAQPNQQSQSTIQATSLPNGPSGNAQASNLQRAQLGATLRLNLTPQQASQLTTAQLQTILKQHQAAVQARALAASAESKAGLTGTQGVASPVALQKPVQQTSPSPGSLASILTRSTPNNLTPVGNSVTVNKTPTVSQPSVQLFKIDPTLTEEKADEVKKLLANRTIGIKMSSLTREQQQLVLAFQAQIKTMSPPVQQYYLRNPQLFMQKVMQQIRAGKPFVLQVRTDAVQNKTKVVATTVTPSKPQHPTISLTQDPPRLKRIGTPSPSMPTHSPVQPVRTASPSVNPIVIPTPTATVTVQVPKKALKRPAPEPIRSVSLVLEQLECHKKMVTNPDCTNPFKSVRDAIRRLVPFHTYNVPNIKEEEFTNSERIFDRMSDRIVTRTRAMVNKYHLLCLRDSTRDSCSAEMVMIERMFLQKEKAKLAEDKARIKDDPSVIKEYFPNTASDDSEEKITVEIADDGTRSRNSSMDSSYCTTQADSRSGNDAGFFPYVDSPSVGSLSTSVYSKHGLYGRRTESDSRSFSHESFSSLGDSRPPGSVGSGSRADEVLLQEAVDSILS